ncbi:hypothetical protein [Frateuria sp. YIM B11624]|uniref:hypothetical protein n=1 Tax=Frateuria sp. YIM B11624 TaxID=3143185 RepID=UPI003C709371
MGAPVRIASETSAAFDARLSAHLGALQRCAAPAVEVPAALVYAEGVTAGLSLAIAALQRRERIIDHLSRWESRLRGERERCHG